MSNIIPFPVEPGHGGYCGNCHHEIRIHSSAAWPEQCAFCRCSPFFLVNSPEVTISQSSGFAGLPYKDQAS